MKIRINEETVPEAVVKNADVYIIVLSKQIENHSFGPMLKHILEDGGFQVEFTKARFF